MEIEKNSDGMIVAVCEWDIVDGRTLYIRELEASAGFKEPVKWAMGRLKKLSDRIDAVIWTREYKYPGREFVVTPIQQMLRRVR